MSHGILCALSLVTSLLLSGCVTINVYPGAPNPVAMGSSAIGQGSPPIAGGPQRQNGNPAETGFVMPVPVCSPRPIDTAWSAAPSPTPGPHGTPLESSSRCEPGARAADSEKDACAPTPGRTIRGEL